MLPINLLLFYKMIMGVRWVVKRFKRTAMQTYYRVSWTFYSAYILQSTFLMCFAWNVFNDTFRILTLSTLIACLPLAIFLTFYMSYLDRQNRWINSIRKQKHLER